MIRMLNFILVPMLAYLLLACSGGGQQSDKFPTEVLFQYTSMSVNQESIEVVVDYYSNGRVFLSANEKQFLLVNNNDPRYILEYTYELFELQQPLHSGDLISVIFERANESSLTSTVQIDFTDIISPQPAQVVDLSTEDLYIEWDPLIQVQRIALSGSCILNDDFSLEDNSSSLTIAASEISGFTNSESECDISISLFHDVTGTIDPSFAGGTFDTEVETRLGIRLTGLSGAVNE